MEIRQVRYFPAGDAVTCRRERDGAHDMCAPLTSDRFAEWSEARAKLFGKELRLFPCGEVPALRDLVVIHELRIRPLCPIPRRLVQFIREDAHGSWDFDALGTEKGELILPIEAS